ncbi:accessory Sec system translocase SecA2 [Microbacterium sp. AG238]|uniref:accessory Sec system translocase SecA2 n=1 Tax=Microbacterium sp. AG238 TaxID=2183994 RepID=UPI000FEE0EC3|nr:accessory Sec system translocase SecA2 [Microbacterium sp. AG238]RKE60602.1 protein translocase subunit secA [Microbacterium sp. AG238]
MRSTSSPRLAFPPGVPPRDVSLWTRLLDPVRRLIGSPGSLDISSALNVADRVELRRRALESLPDAQFDSAVAEAQRGALRWDLDAGEELLALIADAARRELGLEAYREQIAAVFSLLSGRVVDMATGEGKTLVGFLASAAWAASGRRVHVLSANSYLAQRDAAAGRAFFARLGIDVASVDDEMSGEDRQRGYSSHVVYTTAHQVGFDLLRDRQRTSESDRLLPATDVALIDEIDAVLIDDAVVPLVLAADRAAEESDTELPHVVAQMQERVHYEVSGDGRSAAFTDAGLAMLEAAYGITDLYATDHTELLAAAHVALHAQALLQRDVHYIVSDSRLKLISEPRGRVVERQRWPDGLQAALERKEGLLVTGQAQIRDQILVETVVNGYATVAGMSGSALEAAERLDEDLGMSTVAIPPHRSPARVDEPDRLYRSQPERDAAAAEGVMKAHDRGQPVLIGTQSVQASESFAGVLRAHGLEVRVLNAKNDAAEASVIAQAGQPGAVTVSTQMAGRGVDIALPPVSARAGGLFVVGLARHDSPRLDRQLRGRSGRQGEPGRTVFYTSLDDAVVKNNLRINLVPRSIGPDGLIDDQRFRSLYDHAQRVADGKLLQLHRNTRRYNSIIDEQRDTLLRLRETLLSDAGLERFIERLGEGEAGLAERWASHDRRALAREVTLLHLDEAWSEHLAGLAEVREGIHLRVLGRQNPLDEFALIAARNLPQVVDEFRDAVRAILLAAPEEAQTLSDLQLSRPSSTWTYMVSDNPFGSEADRIVSYLNAIVHGRRPRGVEYV